MCFFLEFRTGKTQLSHTLCGRFLTVIVKIVSYNVLWCLVTAQLPGKNNYSGGKVVFIDTEVSIQSIFS